MSETNLLKEIQLEFSRMGHRLFRCNTAQGWVGESARFTQPMTVKVYPGDVLIRRAKPLHAGLCEGGSDGIGWMGDGTGRILAVEAKTIGSTTDKARLIKQQNFIDQINKSGGVAFFATSVEDALNKINPCI